MKTVYVLFRDGFGYGEKNAVGWYESREAAEAAALKMEWDDYRSEVARLRPGGKIASPDETDYRRFVVEPIDRLD